MITFKERVFDPNLPAIRRLTNEISRANVSNLVLIHGGGSFGHPLAEQYSLKAGYKDKSQLIGFSRAHQTMNELNKLVVDSLINNNIPAVAVQPSSCIVTENGRIHSLEVRPLIKMLGMGFTPVLYGDVVLDFETGFTILSGDQLVTSLAITLGAERIIFGVDVNGLFTDDPKTDPSARLLKEISLKKMKTLVNRIGGSTETDVTGGMFGKMFEIIKVLESGIQTLIVNAKKPERIYKALRGEKVVGTVLRRGESLG